MSYLQGSGGPSGTKAIISFWVQGSGGGPADPWPDKWLPPHLDETMAGNMVAYSGASYWFTYPQMTQPHLFVYPPGDEYEQKVSFRDGMAPFLSWGKPGKYDRAEWKLKVLREDYWTIQGTKSLVSQFPETVGPVDGVVPPSCIGSHKGNLRIILQTGSKARYKGYAWAMERAKIVHVQTPLIQQHGENAGVVSGYEDKYEATPRNPTMAGNAIWYKDVSSLECGHPEAFVMDTGIGVTGGWHHILLSYDLSGGSVTAKATGPDATRPWPGTFGQYSGPRGEMEPYQGPFPESGAPNEDSGLGSGPANGGVITSECLAWLMVDGELCSGKQMHHRSAWAGAEQRGADLSPLIGTNKIVPPNALVCLNNDPRLQMTTSNTDWERFYRTMLGGFYGPAAQLDVTDEKRRFTYELPSYELSSASLAGGGFAIPAGTLWSTTPGGDDGLKWNVGCKMAELQIWTGKARDVSEIIDLFLRDGKPASPLRAEKELGKPSLKLHFAENWKYGGKKKPKPGAPPQKASGLTPKGQIDRVWPNPSL